MADSALATVAARVGLVAAVPSMSRISVRVASPWTSITSASSTTANRMLAIRPAKLSMSALCMRPPTAKQQSAASDTRQGVTVLKHTGREAECAVVSPYGRRHSRGRQRSATSILTDQSDLGSAQVGTRPLIRGPAQRVIYAGPDQSLLNRDMRSEWLD